MNGLQLGLLRTPPDFNNFPYLDPTTGLHRSFRLQNPGPLSGSESRGFDNPIFVLNVPVILFSLAVTARSAGESRDPGAAPIDWGGAAVLFAALSLLVASLLAAGPRVRVLGSRVLAGLGRVAHRAELEGILEKAIGALDREPLLKVYEQAHPRAGARG